MKEKMGFSGVSVVMCMAALLASCTSFGPRELKQGHLAYNTAVKATLDEELLLNIVRLRYLDTLEFLEATSISAQSSFTASLGAALGTELAETTALAIPEVSYSTRPTFTFIPQRGHEFAENIMKPLEPYIFAYLAGADWDISALLHLLVRDMNGLSNRLEGIDPEFTATAQRFTKMQLHNNLRFSIVEEREVLSDPIPVSQVSGSDLVEAARSGYRFERQSERGAFVLTGKRLQPVVYIRPGSEEHDAVLRSLKLKATEEDYYEIREGPGTEPKEEEVEAINLRMGSLMDAIVYLSGGVFVPVPHVQQNLATPEWPAGIKTEGVKNLFQVHHAKEKPDASLAVRYRDYWFYLEETDHDSRGTFLLLAELFRLGLTETKSRQAPVLTLPVGGP
jgi:hypothetical protein